jgi:hypothetical protein
MAVDSQFAFEQVKALSYPRFILTEGEKKARDYIKAKMKESNLEVTTEEFPFSFFPMEVLMRIAILLQALVIFSAAFLFARFPAVSVALCIFIIVMLCLSSRWNKLFEFAGKIGKKHTSHNVIGKMMSGKGKATVIVSAHYDTKSQFMPISVRIPLFVISLLGSLLLSFILLVAGLARLLNFQVPASSLYFYSGVFVSLVTLSLLFNVTGNKSDGSGDDASGIAAILALAKAFQEEKLKNLDLLFLATSGEEVELFGAMGFVKAHEKEMDRNRTFNINIDGIGANRAFFNSGYGIPVTRTSKKLNAYIKQISAERGVKIKGAYLPTGAAADHMPFVEHGFEAASIHSVMPFVHTKKDNIERINQKNLENAIVVIYETIKKLDAEYD